MTVMSPVRGSGEILFRRLAIAVAVLFVVLVPASPASAATPGLVWSATIDGRQVDTATPSAPIRLGSADQARIEITLDNRSDRQLEVRSVRLEGRVIGMAFFSYSTRLDVVLPPGAQTARRFDVDITDLTGQATGKLPATVSLVGPDRTVLDHKDFTVGVAGSMFSVYGAFGLIIAGHHRDRARRAADRDLATSAAPQPLAARDQVPAGRGRDRSRAHLHRLGHRSAGAEPGLVAAGGAGLCGYCLPGRLSAPGRCRTRRIRRIGAPGNHDQPALHHRRSLSGRLVDLGPGEGQQADRGADADDDAQRGRQGFGSRSPSTQVARTAATPATRPDPTRPTSSPARGAVRRPRIVRRIDSA